MDTIHRDYMTLYSTMIHSTVCITFKLFIRQTGVSNWKWYDTLYGIEWTLEMNRNEKLKWLLFECYRYIFVSSTLNSFYVRIICRRIFFSGKVIYKIVKCTQRQIVNDNQFGWISIISDSKAYLNKTTIS